VTLSGARWANFAVVMLLVLCLACGGNDDSASTPAPTRPASPALLPVESIAAIGEYISDTGLDGQSFELTEPAGCEEIQEEEGAATSNEQRQQIIEATRGRLCINRGASLIRDDRAVATVQEYVSGAGWVVSLELTDGVWTVTDVQPLGFSETE
jgi:hypothetical protein